MDTEARRQEEGCCLGCAKPRELTGAETVVIDSESSMTFYLNGASGDQQFQVIGQPGDMQRLSLRIKAVAGGCMPIWPEEGPNRMVFKNAVDPRHIPAGSTRFYAWSYDAVEGYWECMGIS